MLRILEERLPFCWCSPVSVSLSSRSRSCITVKCRLGRTQNILLYVLPFAAQIAHTAAAVLSSTSVGVMTELNYFQTLRICYQWRSSFLGPETNKQINFQLQAQDHCSLLKFVLFYLNSKYSERKKTYFLTYFNSILSNVIPFCTEIKSVSVQTPLIAIYYRTTCCDISQVVLMFTIGLWNVLRKKCTLRKSIQHAIIKIIKTC